MKPSSNNRNYLPYHIRCSTNVIYRLTTLWQGITDKQTYISYYHLKYTHTGNWFGREGKWITKTFDINTRSHGHFFTYQLILIPDILVQYTPIVGDTDVTWFIIIALIIWYSIQGSTTISMYIYWRQNLKRILSLWFYIWKL